MRKIKNWVLTGELRGVRRGRVIWRHLVLLVLGGARTGEVGVVAVEGGGVVVEEVSWFKETHFGCQWL